MWELEASTTLNQSMVSDFHFFSLFFYFNHILPLCSLFPCGWTSTVGFFYSQKESCLYQNAPLFYLRYVISFGAKLSFPLNTFYALKGPLTYRIIVMVFLVFHNKSESYLQIRTLINNFLAFLDLFLEFVLARTK